MKRIDPYVPPANAAARLAKCNPEEVASAHRGWEVRSELRDHDFLARYPNPTAFACAVLLEKAA